jgi:hypothetical protein
MTGLDIFRDIRDILTAIAAIVAGIKAWLADSKSKRIEKEVSEIKIMLVQQQTQKQTQNINVNVGTGTAGDSTEGAVTLSDSEGEEQS